MSKKSITVQYSSNVLQPLLTRTKFNWIYSLISGHVRGSDPPPPPRTIVHNPCIITTKINGYIFFLHSSSDYEARIYIDGMFEYDRQRTK
jgi:hypothetical protein